MESNPITLLKLRFFVTTMARHLLSYPKLPAREGYFLYSSIATATCSTICQAEVEKMEDDPQAGVGKPEHAPGNPVDVLKKWGCSDDDISKIFTRRPSLRNADIGHLQSKLNILSGLGLRSSDLVKIINCRPRFLCNRLNRCFDERLEYFTNLFGSKEMFCKAIVRNPSLLTYDFHHSIKPTLALYDQMGLSREELIPMLISRPTLIPRSTLNDQKLEYIRKSGVSKTSKMYKYVVTLLAISRIETIQEKVANFEKFGFSEDEIWSLFGKTPLILTLSIDKVQRNMTFVVGTLKMPASVIVNYPFLLYNNHESVMRPRVVLAGKIQEMGLSPGFKEHGAMLRALRMTEKRFLKAFVECHPREVAEELMEVYRNAKCVKRLAENSKMNLHKGFPF